MTSYLEHLPLDVLRNILIFVAYDVKTMLRCELVSRSVHQAVQDDKTWEFLPDALSWKGEETFNTYRLAACARAAFLSIRREQEATDNIIVQQLGVERWNDTVSSIFLTIVPIIEPPAVPFQDENYFVRLLESNQFLYRGDTLAVFITRQHASVLERSRPRVFCCRGGSH